MANQKLIIVLVVLILAGLFYWYEWRPADIRSTCQKTYLKIGGIGGWSNEDIQEAYEHCIHENGLTK